MNIVTSLISGIFIGGIAGYLGSLMVTKRMALAGDALGHMALPGMGLALLLGLDVSFGAFIFLALGIILIWLFEIRTKLPAEALAGVVFVTSLALGVLIVPEIELVHALIGDISQMGFKETVILIILTILTFLLIAKIYSGQMLSSISEDLAKVSGIRLKTQNLIYFFSIGLIVALGVKIVGSLLVGALMILPAVTARNFSRNLKQYSLGSIVLGILSCILGILFSKWLNWPAGPMVILTGTFFFLTSLIFKR